MQAESYKIRMVLLDVNVCIDLIVNRSSSRHLKKELFSVFHRYDIEPFVPAFSTCIP